MSLQGAACQGAGERDRPWAAQDAGERAGSLAWAQDLETWQLLTICVSALPPQVGAPEG